MHLVNFTIPGRLKGKGRARSAIRRGKSGQQFVQVYADMDTVNAEAMVRQIGSEAMADRPPFEGPLVLNIRMIRNTTASWSKKRRASERWVTGKPDCSNVLKMIEDALNGITWRDDAQICRVSFERRYDDSRGECAEISVSAPGIALADCNPTPARQRPEINAPLFARGDAA